MTLSSHLTYLANNILYLQEIFAGKSDRYYRVLELRRITLYDLFVFTTIANCNSNNCTKLTITPEIPLRNDGKASCGR